MLGAPLSRPTDEPASHQSQHATRAGCPAAASQCHAGRPRGGAQPVGDQSRSAATAVRSFKIGSSDYIGALILPHLMKEIEMASGLLIHLDWTDRNVGDKLRSGELDLAVLPRRLLEEDLHAAELFVDELVVIASKRWSRFSQKGAGEPARSGAGAGSGGRSRGFRPRRRAQNPFFQLPVRWP